MKQAVFSVVFLWAVNEGISSQRPIIGILTQELTYVLQQLYPKHTSYIAASYVKATEGSGAQVVPIFIGRDDEYYREVISNVNGILLPGGQSMFNVSGGYADAGNIIYRIAKEINAIGDYFPVFGVCLGFELLLHSANNKQELRADCSSQRVALPLRFKEGFANSQLFAHADAQILYILSTESVTSNHHLYCVTEVNMTKFGLDKEWKVLTVNKDESGFEFISSIEMHNYPIAGVQFHPEKNAYEWKKSENNPHSYSAVYSARYFYDWLTNRARINTHYFPTSEKERDSSIHNYIPTFTAKSDYIFDEVYLFN